jgi:hypothetical protein
MQVRLRLFPIDSVGLLLVALLILQIRVGAPYPQPLVLPLPFPQWIRLPIHIDSYLCLFEFLAVVQYSLLLVHPFIK